VYTMNLKRKNKKKKRFSFVAPPSGSKQIRIKNHIDAGINEGPAAVTTPHAEDVLGWLSEVRNLELLHGGEVPDWSWVMCHGLQASP